MKEPLDDIRDLYVTMCGKAVNGHQQGRNHESKCIECISMLAELDNENQTKDTP